LPIPSLLRKSRLLVIRDDSDEDEEVPNPADVMVVDDEQPALGKKRPLEVDEEFDGTIRRATEHPAKRVRFADEVCEERMPENKSSFCTNGTCMLVLGGFITALGLAAVALSYVVLNAATLGIAGLVMTGVGVAMLVAGTGFFALGKQSKSNTSEEVIDLVDGLSLSANA
jgi:hypothetical protein